MTTSPLFFFLRVRNVSEKTCRKIKTHISYQITFLRYSCRLIGNMEKYDRAGQTTDDNTIGRIRFACRQLRLQTHTKNV
jgi:hypothetical protein